MPDPITIRRATPADADSVANLWLASFKATYAFPAAHTDEQVRGWIRDDVLLREETYLAVEPDGGIVGLMSLEGGDLDQLYVHPDHFDRGIGSRFVELAKERRPDGLGLYTFQVNGRARAFYERRGFRVERLGNGEGNEEHQPDVRYVWSPTTDT